MQRQLSHTYFLTGLHFVSTTVARKCHSKQSKKKYIKIKIFVLDPKFLSSQHEVHYPAQLFSPKLLLRIESYYSGSKVIIPDPELFLRILSFYSGSKVTIPDPKFITPYPKLQLRIQSSLLRIQSYNSGSKVLYSESKVITPDPKFLLQIQSFYSGSKNITPDPRFLLKIQSFYSGSRVITPDPKFLLWIQSYYSDRKQIKIQSNLICQ